MKTPLFKSILRFKLTFLAMLFTVISIAQNTAPIAVNDTISVRIGSTFIFDPMVNDYDPDGDTFVLSDVSNCGMAHVSIVNNQLLIKIYYAAIKTTDSVSYKIIDQYNNTSSLGWIIFNLRPNMARDSLTVNNIFAPFGAWGPDFWDRSCCATYRAPKNMPTSTIYSSSLWFSAYDALDTLYLSADTYQQFGSDFNVGPVRDSISQLNDGDSIYQRVWKITKAEISNHRNNYWQSGYVMPEAILNWPAMGNMSNGMASKLAKFTDVDNDGIYNPANGDYPNIKGDECILSIFNDDCIHKSTNGNSLKIEIHLLSYAFGCPDDTALNNTIFQHYEIYNRSNNDYHDFVISNFTDFDLGSPNDDYFGCDTLRNSFFVYNADNNDSSSYNNNWYGVNPPSQGVTFLSHEMTSSTMYINSTLPNINGGPTTLMQHYNSMRGLFLDGSPMKVGGDGSTGTVTTKYKFFGNPADTNQWVMKPSIMSATDIRSIGSIGPFNLKKDSLISFDLAYIYARDTTKTNIQNVGLLKQYIDRIQWAYDNDTTECGGNFSAISSINTMQKKISIYPNPASSEIFISTDFKLQNAKYQIYNIAGQLIKNGQINNSPKQVSIVGLNSGLYFIRITDKELVYTRKFIIR